MKSARRLNALTSLRAVAAACIVAFHLQIFGFQPALSLGVSFFFVLSGFILAYNYRDMPSVRTFYLHRAARIIPVHVAMFVAAVVFIHRIKITDPLIAAANLLLVHSWLPTPAYYQSFNGVSWSISVELAFYIVFPLIIRARPFLLVCAAILALVIVQLWMLGFTELKFARNFIIISPSIRILEFATGVAAGRLYFDRRIPKVPPKWATLAEVAAVTAIVAFVTASADISAKIFPFSGSLSAWIGGSGGALLFVVLIVVFADEAGRLSRLLATRPFVLLGEISFSTYMIHVIMLWYVQQQAWDVLLHGPGLIVLLAAIYAASYLLWRLVEVPSRKAIISLFRPSGPALRLSARLRSNTP